MADLSSYLMQYLYHGLDTPISYKPEDRSKACAEYNRSQLTRILDTLEARLAEREYLLGAFTLADVAAASVLGLGMRFGLAMERHPRTAAWCRRCMERPAFKRAR
jgi:glutathione S-transferase